MNEGAEDTSSPKTQGGDNQFKGTEAPRNRGRSAECFVFVA